MMLCIKGDLLSYFIENRDVGLELMKEAGAVITSTETVIFQILKRAGTKEFKEMLKIVK